MGNVIIYKQINNKQKLDNMDNMDNIDNIDNIKTCIETSEIYEIEYNVDPDVTDIKKKKSNIKLRMNGANFIYTWDTSGKSTIFPSKQEIEDKIIRTTNPSFSSEIISEFGSQNVCSSNHDYHNHDCDHDNICEK